MSSRPETNGILPVESEDSAPSTAENKPTNRFEVFKVNQHREPGNVHIEDEDSAEHDNNLTKKHFSDACDENPTTLKQPGQKDEVAEKVENGQMPNSSTFGKDNADKTPQENGAGICSTPSALAPESIQLVEVNQKPNENSSFEVPASTALSNAASTPHQHVNDVKNKFQISKPINGIDANVRKSQSTSGNIESQLEPMTAQPKKRSTLFTSPRRENPNGPRMRQVSVQSSEHDHEDGDAHDHDTYRKFDTTNLKTFGRNTHEAIPQLDFYRQTTNSPHYKRPTLDELHEEKVSLVYQKIHALLI